MKTRPAFCPNSEAGSLPLSQGTEDQRQKAQGGPGEGDRPQCRSKAGRAYCPGLSGAARRGKAGDAQLAPPGAEGRPAGRPGLPVTDVRAPGGPTLNDKSHS